MVSLKTPGSDVSRCGTTSYRIELLKLSYLRKKHCTLTIIDVEGPRFGSNTEFKEDARFTCRQRSGGSRPEGP